MSPINADTHSPAPRSERALRRWVALVARIVVIAAVLLWFVPFAYLRMTTLPPGAGRAAVGPAAAPEVPENDATLELIQAVAALNPPRFDEPAPAGMRWVLPGGSRQPIDVGDVTAGPWDPPARPHLRAALRYLTSEPVENALARVRALRGRPWRMQSAWWSPTGSAGAGQLPAVGWREVRNLTRTLTARVRYRHAELHDQAGAWDDLKTALWLSHTAPPNNLMSLLMGGACEGLCMQEIMQMSQELEFDEQLAAAIDDALKAARPIEEMWHQAVSGELAPIRELIDATFTDDGEGNGWLVLSAPLPATLARWSRRMGRAMVPAGRSRLWNLASPLYNDRRRVVAKLDAFQSAVKRATQLAYCDAIGLLERCERQPLFNPLDGPALPEISAPGRSGNYGGSYRLIVYSVAGLRAGRATVALNRFKARNGCYPKHVGELVPALLDAVPLDPYCDQPFHYRRTESGFVLYACGEDGKDNGGQAPKRTADAAQVDTDVIFTQPRGQPYYEPKLERAEPGSTADGKEP